MSVLDVVHKTALPLRELSALALRGGKLLAVGDEEFAVLAAELDEAGRPGDTKRHDLVLALVGTGIDLRDGSGFEGVAADGTGAIVILQEEQSRLLIFDKACTELLQVIVLDVPADTPDIGPGWHEEPNKRGEGLLLLKHGHVVLAEQKDVHLIEFGPAGDEPIGITQDTLLAPDGEFAHDAAALVPLAWWPLDLDSANDLAVDADGRVHVLSSKGHKIVRLEHPLERDTPATIDETWTLEGLPGGDDAHPEGLVLLPGDVPVVCVDRKAAGDNLAVFAAI
jgi:hypothetical protein